MKKTLLIVTSALILSASVRAEDLGLAQSQFYVQPVRQTIVVAPGQSESGVYELTSISKNPLKISVSVRDWRSAKANAGMAVSDWLEIKPSTFTLFPGSSQTITYHVRMPEKARQELSAMITFIPEASEDQLLNLVIGVSLYARVLGHFHLNGAIDGMRFVTAPGEPRPTRLAVMVRNTGDAHIRPEGGFQIKKGKKIIKSLAFQSGQPVYPEAANAFFAEWDGSIPSGKYTLEAHVTYSNENPELVQKSVLKVRKDGSLELVN